MGGNPAACLGGVLMSPPCWNILLPNSHNVSFGSVLLLWYDLSKMKAHEIPCMERYEPVEGRFT
jgi:hypothetical protein